MRNSIKGEKVRQGQDQRNKGRRIGNEGKKEGKRGQERSENEKAFNLSWDVVLLVQDKGPYLSGKKNPEWWTYESQMCTSMKDMDSARATVRPT